MIRTLKKKFILTAMIAVTVLLVLMLGALNAVNAWSSRQETDQLLELLTRMEAQGIRPDRGEGLWPPHREDDEGKQMPEPGETPFDELLNDGRLPDGGRGGFLSAVVGKHKDAKGGHGHEGNDTEDSGCLFHCVMLLLIVIESAIICKYT